MLVNEYLLYNNSRKSTVGQWVIAIATQEYLVLVSEYLGIYIFFSEQFRDI